MAIVNLKQKEADGLLAMEKQKVDETVYRFPSRGGALAIPLTSVDLRENFLLDIRRSRANLRKGTYQTRARSSVVLARLDFGGAPHRNPDGAEIASPHLHLYREDYGDKWAVSIPPDFADITDAWTTLQDFMRYCAIVKPPRIQRGVLT